MGDPYANRAAKGGVWIGDVHVPGKVLIAPMTGVSDLPFRQIATELRAAYVATEMVASAEFAKGRADVVRRAAVGEGLSLTVIQLVGSDPDHMAQGAHMAEAAGADLIDLNFGCPAKEVTGVKSGSALMRDPERAMAIMKAVVAATARPVTVKMRLGWDHDSLNALELAKAAQDIGVKAVTIHARTRQMFYKGRADWSAIAPIKAALSIPVIANGDIIDTQTAKAALGESHADAVMIGRGVYGQPWLAAQIDAELRGDTAVLLDLKDRYEIFKQHFLRSLDFHGPVHGVRIFRKHLGWYIDAAGHPLDPEDRRMAKADLCRQDDPLPILQGIKTLWGL